jgi:hypothetical protein
VREQAVELPLRGVRLPDARTGERLDLHALPGARVLTLIRHRY